MKLSYTKVSRGIKGATDKSSIWDRRKIITWEGSELNENFIKSHSASQVIKNCPAWKLTASLRGKKSYYSLPSSSEILNTSYSMEFCFVCVWKYTSSLLIRPTQYIICKRVLGTQNVYCLCTLGFGEREGEIVGTFPANQIWYPKFYECIFFFFFFWFILKSFTSALTVLYPGQREVQSLHAECFLFLVLMVKAQKCKHTLYGSWWSLFSACREEPSFWWDVWCQPCS